MIPGIRLIRGIRGKGSAAPDGPSLIAYEEKDCNGGLEADSEILQNGAEAAAF